MTARQGERGPVLSFTDEWTWCPGAAHFVVSSPTRLRGHLPWAGSCAVAACPVRSCKDGNQRWCVSRQVWVSCAGRFSAAHLPAGPWPAHRVGAPPARLPVL